MGMTFHIFFQYLPIWNELCNDDLQPTSAFHRNQVLTCSWHCEQRLSGFLALKARHHRQ